MSGAGAGELNRYSMAVALHGSIRRAVDDKVAVAEFYLAQSYSEPRRRSRRSRHVLCQRRREQRQRQLIWSDRRPEPVDLVLVVLELALGSAWQY